MGQVPNNAKHTLQFAQTATGSTILHDFSSINSSVIDLAESLTSATQWLSVIVTAPLVLSLPLIRGGRERTCREPDPQWLQLPEFLKGAEEVAIQRVL